MTNLRKLVEAIRTKNYQAANEMITAVLQRKVNARLHEERKSLMTEWNDDDDRGDFADPGGKSALRAAGKGNPRNLPCPTCKQPNKLTRKDKALGYQCDACADRDEGGGY